MGDDDEAPPRFASKAFPIVVYYAWLAEGIAMRVILCLGLLLSQILTASADSDPIPACKPDLQTMRFTAVTRYCVGSGLGEANGTTKTCNYDCLISSEAVSVPVQNDCPLTVKLRLFEDGSREVIEPIIPPSLDNAT